VVENISPQKKEAISIETASFFFCDPAGNPFDKFMLSQVEVLRVNFSSFLTDQKKTA
jgi:hypothetical protein